MAIMQWNEILSVGVSGIDAQYAQLVDVLDDLHGAMASGQADQTAQAILVRPVSYTKEHFTYEETLTAEARYPGLGVPKREHEA